MDLTSNPTRRNRAPRALPCVRSKNIGHLKLGCSFFDFVSVFDILNGPFDLGLGNPKIPGDRFCTLSGLMPSINNEYRYRATFNHRLSRSYAMNDADYFVLRLPLNDRINAVRQFFLVATYVCQKHVHNGLEICLIASREVLVFVNLLNENIFAVGKKILGNERVFGRILLFECIQRGSDSFEAHMMLVARRCQNVRLGQIVKRQQLVLWIGGFNHGIKIAAFILPAINPMAQRGGMDAKKTRDIGWRVDRQFSRVNVLPVLGLLKAVHSGAFH
jgi:hypothetical protein